MILGLSILIGLFLLFNIILIVTFDIKQVSNINIIVKPDVKNPYLSWREIKKPQSTLNYLDSIQTIIDSNIPIYFYELPYSFNFAYSKMEYPGTRHSKRFIAINKERWIADFLDMNREHHLISEESLGIESFDNHRVALNDNEFQYICNYFIINAKFHQISLIEKTKWFLRSEYGL